jgi:hypothetical protein
MFDFIIPLYSFIRTFNGSDTVDTRRILVRSDGVWSFQAMMKIFSQVPVHVVDEENPSWLMPAGVIGIEKFETDINPGRTYDESIAFRYEFNRSTAVGLRESIFTELKLPVADFGVDGKPLVLLIDRGSETRNIGNIQEVFETLASHCPHCVVEMVQFHNIAVEEQMRKTSRASVLMGLHGSGLTHTVWMRESRPNCTTHLVEVIPYKYLCRDWYETAAAVAGVQYHRVMNRNDPENVTDEGLKTCWAKPEICATQQCHDKLRDQPTRVEIDTLLETWDAIAEQLRWTVFAEEGVHSD